jgi:hypothetical protein
MAQPLFTPGMSTNANRSGQCEETTDAVTTRQQAEAAANSAACILRSGTMYGLSIIARIIRLVDS